MGQRIDYCIMQPGEMQTEKIQARIETYTSNLTQAVQSGSGAQFSMLLSLIAANQEMPSSGRPVVRGEGFELPETELQYPNPNDLYNADVAERLNLSVNKHQRGEFAYINSYIETEAMVPSHSRRVNDSLAKMGLISGGAMLSEIVTSQQQINQTA